jgi:hypothetical protein
MKRTHAVMRRKQKHCVSEEIFQLHLLTDTLQTTTSPHLHHKEWELIINKDHNT